MSPTVGEAPRAPSRQPRRGLWSWKNGGIDELPLHLPRTAPRVLIVSFLDRFRRSADPPPVPEPDDPRVTALTAEIAEARGHTFPWLIWSGPLFGEGEAATEATALVRRRWGQHRDPRVPRQQMERPSRGRHALHLVAQAVRGLHVGLGVRASECQRHACGVGSTSGCGVPTS
jgi:hypothetical protein